MFSPAVADGKVYLTMWEGALDYITVGRIYCLNAATGAHIWAYETGGRDMISSPAVADDKVYACSDDGKMYCLNAVSGASIWNYTIGALTFSSLAVTDGKVYVGSDIGKIYCLNAATGELLWNYTIGSMAISSPAVANGRVYVGSADNKVYCLNAENGAYAWSYNTNGPVYSSPAVADARVFVGSYDNNIYCLDAAFGAFIWSYTTGNSVRSSPAVANGKVFVGSMDGKIYCLDALSGASIWDYAIGSDIYSSPTVADGKVYVGSIDGNIYCLDAAYGAFIWSYTTGDYIWDSSPAVAYGKVYIGSYGEFYCFGSPCISDFDSLFKHNNVRIIYPSDETPKPLGCSPAMVSDWTASAFISTKLENFTEGTDVDSAFVDQTTGKPVGVAGTGFVSFGGPFVNPVVRYAESGPPNADCAPIRFLDEVFYPYFRFVESDSTEIPDAVLPVSVINNGTDMFVIESYRDADGRYMLLCYGFGWQGTYAAGKYFDSEIYPQIANYPYSWIIVKWEDTNANGFVNTATEGDTYTVIATG
jgi:outer membrane protein assembly factor BamB